MKRIWFHIPFGILPILFSYWIFFASTPVSVLAQQPTNVPSGIFITVTTEEPQINVVNEAPVVAAETPVVAVEKEVKQLGRPTNPESARQKRLAEAEAKRAAGLIKRGRPVIEGSAHQKKLAEQAKRKEENGGEARRGRPVNPTSPRQMRLAAAAAKIAAGEVIKRGRPEGTKSAPAEGIEVVINQDGK